MTHIETNSHYTIVPDGDVIVTSIDREIQCVNEDGIVEEHLMVTYDPYPERLVTKERHLKTTYVESFMEMLV